MSDFEEWATPVAYVSDDEEWGDGGVSAIPEVGAESILDSLSVAATSNPSAPSTIAESDILLGLINPQLLAARSFTDNQLTDYLEAFVLEFMSGLGYGIVETRDEAIMVLFKLEWKPEDIINHEIASLRSGIDSAEISSTDESEICAVCWENPATDGLRCGHKHCAQCWTDHIHSMVCIQGRVVIPCMARGCEIKMPLSFVEEHPCECATSSYNGLYRSLVRDFCKRRLIVQCASKDCSLWVENSKAESSVLCSCGFRFCFECRIRDREFPDHSPVTCEQQLEWSRKENSLQEDASMSFILTSTLECPSCSYRQQKTPGTCVHTTCGKNCHGQTEGTIQGCGYEYCSMCKRAWKDCRNYSCNGTGIGKTSEEETEAETNERFLVFFTKYHDTQLWMKTGMHTLIGDMFERLELYLQEPSKYPKLQRDDTEAILKNAVAAEISGKQILLNTYILSYFLRDSPGLIMFQECQSKLEHLNQTLFKLNRAELIELDYTELKRAAEESKMWNGAMVKTLAQLRSTQAMTAISSAVID